MPFHIHIDILDLMLKGILIGVIASAQMGPVGVLCIQRTLNKGRWYGFVTGVGAMLSDTLYALVTGFGMSFVMDFINNPRTLFYLKLAGSVMLLIFGVYTYRSDPTTKIRQTHKSKGTLWHNGITAFLVTLSNPLIIFLFMACFAQFAFVDNSHPGLMVLGFLCIVIGALMWWYGLTWLIDKVREKFDIKIIIIFNKVIGIVVIAFSVIFFLGTLFNIIHVNSVIPIEN